MTQDELNAHVTPASGTNLPQRKNLTACNEDTTETTVESFSAVTSYDAGQSAYLVRSKSFTERATAFNCRSTNTTIKNCKIRSSQDSFYCGGTNVYVDSCDIYGGTDYIFGEANAVFNKCNLYFEGYSDNADGGVITAASTDASREYGYLFFDCTIANARTNTTKGNLGRPWYGDAQVTFYNCTVKDNSVGAPCLNDVPWSDMSANKKEEARFYTYGIKDGSGNEINASGGIVNTKAEYGIALSDYQILPYNPRNYLSGWDPMGFGSGYLTAVDAALSSANVTIPAGASTEVTLPTPTEGIEYTWVSASENAKVSEDGTKLTVLRPANGEADISSTVTLYAKDTTSNYGDRKTIDVTIGATTDTTNVFTTQGTVSLGSAPESDVELSIKFYKNSALIKTATATVNAGETSVAYTAGNIPVGTYDVEVTADLESGYTVTSPEDGKATVTGAIGDTVTLDITAQQIVDDTVDLGISYASGSNTSLQTYDLIALAKTAGADSSIDKSDVVTVDYTVNVKSALAAYGYIDLLSGTPNSTIATSGVDSRFVLAKLNSSWNQIDMVDSAQGFSGASNNGNQWLNISGNFDYTTPSKVSVTINYKDEVITVEATGSGKSQTYTSYTFSAFPSSYSKGALNMAVYPTDNTNTNDFEISNVSVTYKKIVSDSNATPEPTVDQITLKYHGNNTDISGGNMCVNNDTYKFSDGVDSSIASLFAATDDATTVDASLIANYKNYVGGTAGAATHPTIKVTAPAGNYKIYYLGYNHGKNMTATIGSQTITASAGTDFAYNVKNSIYILKIYEMDLSLDTAVSDETITFDSTDEYLPDLYAIVITNVGVAQSDTNATPKPTPMIYTSSNIIGGNEEDHTSATWTFTDNVPSELKALIKSESDETKLSSDIVGKFRDYISGTSTSGTHPSISVTAPAGDYKVYYLGVDNDGQITASFEDGGKLSFGTGVVIANTDSPYGNNNSKKDMRAYTTIMTLDSDISGAKLTFDSDQQWLPDLYAIIIMPIEDTLIIYPSQFTGGNYNSTNGAAPYTFTDAADNEPLIKALITDSNSTAGTDLVTSYRDYIGSETATSASGLYLAAGSYTMYYLGRPNQNDVYMTVADSNGTAVESDTLSGSSASVIATNSSARDKSNLLLYKTTFTLENNLIDGTLTFNNSSAYLPDLCSVVIVKNPEFGASAMDSGWYKDAAEAKVGVIRFLQAWDGATVDEYGFYFIGSNGNIIQSSRISNTKDADALNGFYADLINIPEGKTSETDPVYAKAYVVIDGVTYLSSDSIKGWVDWDTQVTYDNK